MSSPQGPLDLSNQLCFAVYSAGHAFNRVYRPLLEPLGITYPQYLVMLALWTRDGRSVGEIGEQLRLDSNTLTPLIKRLESAGHVERRRDPKDERVVRVHLTDLGHGLREKASGFPHALRCAAQLEPEAMANLRDELMRLRDMLEAASGAETGPRSSRRRGPASRG